jgi:hypothetical protein
MSATVASLLDVMQIRLSMCDSGLIKPPREVVDATRALVAELNSLDPLEAIEVMYSKNPIHVQYVRQKAGNILAGFTVDLENLPS